MWAFPPSLLQVRAEELGRRHGEAVPDGLQGEGGYARGLLGTMVVRPWPRWIWLRAFEYSTLQLFRLFRVTSVSLIKVFVSFSVYKVVIRSLLERC